MKYLINVVIILILLGIVVSIITWKNNKNLINKMKITFINTVSIIPKVLLSGCILFVIFEIILKSLKINEVFLDILIISIYGVIIVLLGDYISRIIIKRISHNNVCKEYGGRTLTEKEMKEILNGNQKGFFYWNYILNFLISGLLYSLITEFILSETNLLIIILMSLTSIIFYGTLFKRII